MLEVDILLTVGVVNDSDHVPEVMLEDSELSEVTMMIDANVDAGSDNSVVSVLKGRLADSANSLVVVFDDMNEHRRNGYVAAGSL